MRIPEKIILALCLLPGLKTRAASELGEMIVTEAVADIRSEPKAHSGGYTYDALQETQVTGGERVRVIERKGRWAKVACVEQLEFTHNNRWEGYPGWIRWKFLTNDLTKVRILPALDQDENKLRQKILEAAFRHTGAPYLWGGRSLHDPNYKKTVTGVDCSGLINWSFREAGWNIPRDAHEQYMKARLIAPQDARPGDLIFLAKVENPEKIVHVAFYIGDNHLFEAPQTGEKVRRISLRERFGVSMEEIKNGMIIKDRIITFGSLFPSLP